MKQFQEIAEIVTMVTPENIIEAMQIPVGQRWEGQRTFDRLDDKQKHIVSIMHGTILELSSYVAARVVARPTRGGSYAETQHNLAEYLRRLVVARDKFARRSWRRFAAWVA